MRRALVLTFVAVGSMLGVAASAQTPPETPPETPTEAPAAEPTPDAPAPVAPPAAPAPAMPQGHPPVARTTAASVLIEVQRVTPEGPILPIEGLEVTLERWTRPAPAAAQNGERPRLDAAVTVRTDAAGRATFPASAAPPDLTLVASTVHRGVTFQTDVTPRAAAAGPTVLRVYEPTVSLADLRFDVFAGLEVQESNLIVEETFTILNRGAHVVDLERSPDGLRLPLLVPAAFDRAIDPGLIPSATAGRHMSQARQPDRGRFSFERGGLVYRGPIPPGGDVRLQVRYAIPLVHERLDLALTSPIDVERLLVSAAWSGRVAPRLFPTVPFTTAQREAGGSVQRVVRWDAPPKAGEHAVLRLDRLPRGLEVQRSVALIGSLVAFALFGLLVLASRRRDG